MNDLALVDQLHERLLAAGLRLDLNNSMGVRGVVTRVADDVAWVAGLEQVGYEELVRFDSGALGMALDLARDQTGVILLTHAASVATGEGVIGLGRLPSLPVGGDALGRTLDPLGTPLDGGAPLAGTASSLFRPALEFVERKDVDQPLITGIMVIDAAIPIGRGQRELMIGDRDTGKTALAIDAVAAQRSGDVVCIYVLIGQPLSRVLAVRDELSQAGVADNTVIIAAPASMTPGMQYLAPYAGASMAEAFRDQGRDALIVYDDLTKHANAYRELALLLDRPPGREAFPGDIFYIHAELLERASARRADLGGGSVTALPIVETTDSDLSGYIPTNLISITDGQIYLDPARHQRNERPAVDVGRSVSRIGGRAQAEIVRKTARNLRILISRFEELEALTRVGLEVDASTERTIRRGRVLRELLRQSRFACRPISEQVLTLTAVSEGWLDDAGPTSVRQIVALAIARARTEHPAMTAKLDAGVTPEGDWVAAFKACVNTGRSDGHEARAHDPATA
jgi:F-type H+-transporting ATPase subunit alpha